MEINKGYTQDSLERVAKALDVKAEVLFYPPEVAEIMNLDKPERKEVFKIIESILSLRAKS